MSICEKSAKNGTGAENRIGYSSPSDAMKNGLRETLVYVACFDDNCETNQKPDFLATIDLDPASQTYLQIIHKTEMPNIGDGLQHMGWNACSSCQDCKATRSHLIVPGLYSDRIYVIDVETDPMAPRLQKVIETSDVHRLGKASAPHTARCLPSGDVMISCLGNAEGNAKGTFLLLEQGTFDIKGTWQLEEDSIEFNCDFWYQPRHNVLVSTEWSAPNILKKGLNKIDIDNGLYGQSVNVWDWTTKKRMQRLDLGMKSRIPTEVRFLHEPAASVAFVACVLSSEILRIYKTEANSWASESVIKVPTKSVSSEVKDLSGLLTDILISLDDRFLYCCHRQQGDVRQYDISDTHAPRLVGQLFLSGWICEDENLEITEGKELKEQQSPPLVKGIPVRGGPQMLQLSLDGKRLYVTNSLSCPWEIELHPENIDKGSMMLRVNVDTEQGGLTLDENFLVEFDSGIEAHEMRFPGGDSTSDIWS